MSVSDSQSHAHERSEIQALPRGAN